ncbi:hypothetical protein KOW79_008088 [Hemibagrus wyckioides]|uniref:Uncharacterized protein n=1 Tax=Hemibagrus wyckioides TaxID=337641 RepID=A0A9D3SQL2_9TELE|nr:hypothetical protein KOW79_008088 [Hemibagrus wyckioides]
MVSKFHGCVDTINSDGAERFFRGELVELSDSALIFQRKMGDTNPDHTAQQCTKGNKECDGKGKGKGQEHGHGHGPGQGKGPSHGHGHGHGHGQGQGQGQGQGKECKGKP